MKEIIIYDYANRPYTCVLEDKEILLMNVNVLSGDEVIDIIYTDNTSQHFDSSNCRFESHYDGSYIVYRDQIDVWNSFKFKDTNSVFYGVIYSYCRRDEYDNMFESED